MALAVVTISIVGIGSLLSQKNNKNSQTLEQIAAAYELNMLLLHKKLVETKSYKERIALRSGVEVLRTSWEKDREKCAETMPHEKIYRIDEQLIEIEKMTR